MAPRDFLTSQLAGAFLVGEGIRAKIERREDLSKDEQRVCKNALQFHEDRLAKARRWLAKNRQKPENAYAEVLAILKQREEIEGAYAQLYTTLCGYCSRGRIKLSGIPYRERDDGTWIRGERKVIPPTFFVDPIFHFRGYGPNHKGELGPDAYRCFDDLLNDLKRRAMRRIYAEVCINREDVEPLANIQTGARRDAGRPPIKRDKAKAALASLPRDILKGLSPTDLAKKATEILANRGEEIIILPDTAARARTEIINAK
jgi:hypothetical protein